MGNDAAYERRRFAQMVAEERYWSDMHAQVAASQERDGSIPEDAWAFRVRQWSATTGEQLVGAWHRTASWVRRDGTYSGLVSVCNRVYNGGADMELVGAPDQHPIGYLCVDCFGIDHSDKVLSDQGKGGRV